MSCLIPPFFRSQSHRLAAAAVIAAAALPGLGQAQGAPVPPTMQKVRESGVVVIAHREGSIPFSYFDYRKQPVGFSIDLCMKVVEAMRKELKMPNLRVEFVPVTTAQRLPFVAEGKADMECGGTTNTAARRKQVAFTVTHYFAGGRLMVRADSKLNDLSDFRGQIIATTKGSTQEILLNERIKNSTLNAKLMVAKDPAEAFEFLEQGKAEAFLFDDIVLYGIRARAKEPEKYKIVGNLASVEPYGIVIRKNDPEFKRFADTVLSRLMIDGEMNGLYRRWFQQPIPSPTSATPITLNVPMSPLLRDQMRFPTDKVGDSVDG